MSSRNMPRDIDLGAPEGGDCKYKGLELENGMKVILISSANFKSCGATLAIDIGHIHVSTRISGLLHLMEHVIAINMKNQDKQDGFGDNIDKYGEEVWANTSCNLSIYNYKTTSIDPSLRLFIQYIFNPVFDTKSIEAEIQNVDSEYIINTTDDEKCLSEFINAKWYPNELDKTYGFGGNKYTLQTRAKQYGIDITEELKKFHEKYFSTKRMTLIVFAKDNMDILTHLVTSIFDTRENQHNDTLMNLKEYSPNVSIENYGTKWSIVPTQHDKLLKIRFPLENSYFDPGLTRLDYYARMFEHEGDRSLLSSLKERCWCTAVTFLPTYYGKRYYFILTFNLTQQGLDHIENIIHLVFQYVDTLQCFVKQHRLGDPFSEMMKYNPPTAALVETFFEKIITHIHLTEFANVLKGSYNTEFSDKFRKEIERIMVSMFVPDKIIICVISKEEETNARTPSHIKFKVDNIPLNTIFKWSQHFENEFEHPQITEFVEKLLSGYYAPAYDEVDEHLRILCKRDQYEIWFKPQRSRPFEMYLQLSSEEAYHDAKHHNLNNMLAYALRDSISEKLYDAKKIGINCEIVNNIFGIRITIGYHQYKKQLVKVLLDEIMYAFHSAARINDSRFKMLKEQYITYLKNFTSATPDNRAFDYIEILLTKRIWTYEELLKKIAHLTLDDLNLYLRKFYDFMFMKCLICGEVTNTEARDVWDYLENDCYNIPESDGYQSDVAIDIILPRGSHKLYTVKTASHKSSCTMVYYQIGERFTNMNDRNTYLESLMIINAIIYNHCFDELRTKAHLGYIVESSVIQLNDTCGLAIHVVGHTYETEYVEEQIDDFMQKMWDKIRDMSEDIFKIYKEKAQIYGRYRRLSVADRLFGENKVWEQILLQYPNEEIVCSTSFEQIAELFEEMIHPETRRKLSVHIKSKSKPPGFMKATRRMFKKMRSIIRRRHGPEEIKDIALFKRQCLSSN